MFDKTKLGEMSIEKNTLDKNMKPVQQQIQQPREDIKLYLVVFNNREIQGSVVVGSTSIIGAIEKFTNQCKPNADDWKALTLTVEETTVL